MINQNIAKTIARNEHVFNMQSDGALARDAWITYFCTQYAPENMALDPTIKLKCNADEALSYADCCVTFNGDTMQIEMGLSCWEWINNKWIEC